MMPEYLETRIQAVMAERGCSYREAAAVLARRGAAKRQEKARRDREAAEAVARHRARLAAQRLD